MELHLSVRTVEALLRGCGFFFPFCKKRLEDVVLLFINIFLAVRFWSFKLPMINYILTKWDVYFCHNNTGSLGFLLN